MLIYTFSLFQNRKHIEESNSASSNDSNGNDENGDDIHECGGDQNFTLTFGYG